MDHQRYEVTARSPAPPEAVFGLLADIPRWREWAGPSIRESILDRPGSPDPNGVGAIRKLGSAPVYSREEIVEYDPPHHLAYTILSGVPIRGYRADVDLTAEPGGGTRIRWHGTFAPVVPGTGAALRWLLARTVGGLARRLASTAGRSQP